MVLKNKTILSWDKVLDGCFDLADKIVETPFEVSSMVLVPLIRGGLPIATILSSRLNNMPIFPVSLDNLELLKNVVEKYKTIIVVADVFKNDLSALGDALCAFGGHYNKSMVEGRNFVLCCLTAPLNTNQDDFHRFFSAFNFTDGLISFPWDVESLFDDGNAVFYDYVREYAGFRRDLK